MHQLEHVFFNFFGRKITPSKSVARCVAIVVIFYKKYRHFFKTKSDQNYTSKRTRLHQLFQNFLGSMHPNPKASL